MAGFVFFCTKRNLERKREGKGGRERERTSLETICNKSSPLSGRSGRCRSASRTAAAAAVKPCDKESAAIKTASAAAAAKRGGEGREGLDLAGGEADDAAAAGQ